MDGKGEASAECGIGRCEPRRLRKLANIKCFTGVYSITGLLTASLSMYIVSQITTIEKQFALSSSKTGYLMACNDIGYCLCILIASYFSNRVHIPRTLCISTILYGVSGILCSLPHFMFKPSPLPTMGASDGAATPSSMFAPNLNICQNDTDKELMPMSDNMTAIPTHSGRPTDNTASSVTMMLIAIGMILQGVGKAPRYPMLGQYIDDNTNPRDTGYYMGIITSTAIFGPAIAYGLGGLFSRIYVTLEDVDLHPRDPRWIGAWWLGFLAFGVMAVICAIPLLLFPAKLKKTALIGKSRTPPTRSTGTICQEFLGVFKTIFKVLCVPAFTLMLIACISNVLGMSAAFAFGPKYIETQYNVPAWYANIILAAIGIPAVCIGSFVGGLLTKKFKLNPATCIIMIMCTQIPSTALQFIAMFLNCDQPVINNWPDQLSSSSLPLSCADNCNCDNTFLPVCDGQGTNYFSPCHAGCSQGSLMKFTNCTCVPGGEVSTGLCQFECNMLWPFMIVSFLGSFLSATMMMPIFVFNIRIVPNNLKAMAIGLSALAMSLFAWLPGPVIGGKLVDHACILWSNGDTGSCTYYNMDTLRYNLFGIGICGRAVAIAIMAIILKIVWNKREWPGIVDNVSLDFVTESNNKEKLNTKELQALTK